jgi:hypothetical protein
LELVEQARAIQSSGRREWLPHLRLFSAVAATTVAAVVLTLAGLSMIGRFGTSPNGGPATLAELDTAIASATDVLARSPGFESEHFGYVGDRLSTAVWVEWRANGDQAVLQIVDLDVAAAGWLASPSAAPASTGRDLASTAWIKVDDLLYGATETARGEDRSWSVATPPPGPLAFAVTLATERDPQRPEVDAAEANVHRSPTPDGGNIWTLATTDPVSRAVYTWRIDADGALTSFSFEDPSPAQLNELSTSGVTSARIEFRVLTDPRPIQAPEVGSQLSLEEDFHLPADFPLHR